MSSVRTTTCDRCGKQMVDDETRKDQILRGMPVDPWWHLQFTSTDFGAGKKQRAFRMKFIAWDLCTDCAPALQGVLREHAGVPGFESTDEGE